MVTARVSQPSCLVTWSIHQRWRVCRCLVLSCVILVVLAVFAVCGRKVVLTDLISLISDASPKPGPETIFTLSVVVTRRVEGTDCPSVVSSRRRRRRRRRRLVYICCSQNSVETVKWP